MNFYDKQADTAIYYNKLPHWRQDTVCYFVTFRTADSLPQSKLEYWHKEREKWLAEHPEPRSKKETIEYHKKFSNRMEYWLDQGYGKCILKDESIRQIVTDSLISYADQRYRLWEYTISVNHVHLLIEPIENKQLSKIMRSLKSYTAKCINERTGQSGAFWQKDYFDHIVRSEEQLHKFIKYIRCHNKAAIL